MHDVERKAINLLKSHTDLDQIIYNTFIDGSVIGHLKNDTELFRKILEVFNSINDNTDFSLESPNKNNDKLSFLDLNILIKGKTIIHKMHTNSIETNFVKQKFHNLELRCSSTFFANCGQNKTS